MATEPRNERDPWTRVRDESELREGMAVQLRTCLWCGRIETVFLTESAASTGRARRADGRIVPSAHPRRWKAAGECKGGWGEYASAILDGRLYRLADDQLADDAETTTVPKARALETAGRR